MEKTHVYFVPGLAANTKIFERISLSKEAFELHFLEWNIPLSIHESIESYAQRMCDKIKHENPILIGVSFGGVMVQEMSKLINFKKVIIISSIKSRKELPNRLKIAQKTKAYKLFPSKIAQNIEDYESYFLGDFLKKRAELYKKYLSVRNADYLEWAIHNVLNWQQKTALDYVLHIHGNKDEIFPIKHIKNAIEVDKGTHVMILNKAKTISKIIEKECLVLNQL
ncbi:pimeloyl-ACP methyl ester carboxylesterase [Tenacibaculum adriaticum]|uniref:Pimeloyl-ACP methyl ester carboxylesterase n=1 Tax=Tenacibaculum adriaticum TaxID=413713 RepID=A0A5S5DSB7_9FLAO|nr:alpha/beta hydrolase [Tenacibaculum adriaticum]TYP98268.1 pimeloyl-ACP methyl ester carboxylesterase [Tenacibaculum adriaticum]